jgi:hypothetical protein
MLIFSLGLTDAEINYAFQLIPQQGFYIKSHINKIKFFIFDFIETTKPKISNQQSSFLHRLLSNLTFAGFLVFAIQILKQLFRSVRKRISCKINF